MKVQMAVLRDLKNENYSACVELVTHVFPADEQVYPR
jgi:hypothetical protein